MNLEAAVARKIKIGDARAELQLTQEQLAIRAKLVRKVIYRAERGFSISRLSAHAILGALNEERGKRFAPPLNIEDLDVRIQGDGE